MGSRVTKTARKVIRVPRCKRPHNRIPGNDVYCWYVSGVLVTIGAVVGFALPFGDRVASVMAANLQWLGAALGMMAGVVLAAPRNQGAA